MGPMSERRHCAWGSARASPGGNVRTLGKLVLFSCLAGSASFCLAQSPSAAQDTVPPNALSSKEAQDPNGAAPQPAANPSIGSRPEQESAKNQSEDKKKKK